MCHNGYVGLGEPALWRGGPNKATELCKYCFIPTDPPIIPTDPPNTQEPNDVAKQETLSAVELFSLY